MRKSIWKYAVIGIASCAGVFLAKSFGYFGNKDQTIVMRNLTPQDLMLENISEEAKQVLTKEEVQKDISHLMYAFEYAYSGKYVYPKEYDSMLAELRGLSDNAQEGTKSTDLEERISSILKKFPDGHLDVENEYRARPTTKRSIAMTSSESNEENEAKASIQVETIHGKKVLVAKLPSFLIYDFKDRDIITSMFAEALKSSEAVILDVRGNTGGYQLLPLNLAAQLWGEVARETYTIQDFPMPQEKVGTIYTPASLALTHNFQFFNDSSSDSRVNRNANKDYLARVFGSNFMIEDQSKCENPQELEYGIHEDINNLIYTGLNYKDFGFKGPIYMITDSSCASACELFREALEQHPTFKTIGWTTAGAAQFGSVVFMKLPESHISIWLSISFNKYKDNRRVDGVGYKPHIQLDDDEDPMRKLDTIL